MSLFGRTLSLFLVFSLGLPVFAEPMLCSAIFSSRDSVTAEENRLSEEATRRVLRKMKSDAEQDKVEVQDWVNSLSQRQRSGEAISVLEHTTIQLILRSRLLVVPLGNETNLQIIDIFLNSWHSLTGKPQALDAILDRALPSSALAGETFEVQRFHRLALRTEPDTMKISDPALVKFARKVWPIGLIAIGAAILHNPVLAGFAKGYYLSAFVEYAFHRWMAHASPKAQAFFEKSGIYLKPEDNLTKPHLAHHLLVSPHKNNDPKNYTLQEPDFPLDPAVRVEIVKTLERLGITDPEAQNTYIEGSDVGAQLAPRVNKLAAIITAGTGFALGWLTGGEHWGVEAVFTSIFSTTFIFNVKYNHLNLHRTRAFIIENGNPFEKWLIDTAVYRFISRFHYMHHVRADSNFSMTPAGWDLLLGTARDPTVTDVLNLWEAGFIF